MTYSASFPLRYGCPAAIFQRPLSFSLPFIWKILNGDCRWNEILISHEDPDVSSPFCLIVVISAKKQHQENVDAVETESKEHSAKKYSKEHQKSHHHNHKHKKHSPAEELMNEPEPKPKQAPLEVPEPEIELQENIETSKKAVNDQKHAEQVKDLHLQDLAYEERLQKEKKKGHHGAHRAEVVDKNDEKAEKKLFADQESKHAVDDKVIEDSFEPLKEPTEGSKKNKSKDKKSKDKSKHKNKKASEKNGKDKYSKKSKDSKKNKDKKNKNKDKKKY